MRERNATRIQKNGRRKLTTYMQPILIGRLKKRAIDEGCTLADILERLVVNYLNGLKIKKIIIKSDKSGRKQLTTTMQPNLIDSLKKVAIDEDRTLADILEEIVEGYLA